MHPHGRHVAFPDLGALLWTVRESLDLVLFKLAQVRLILASGSTRWLARADAELCGAIESLQLVEMLRASEVHDLARILGTTAESTLESIGTAAPEPWPAMLAEHRIALARQLIEIELVVADNRRLLSAQLSAGTSDRHPARRPRRNPLADPVAQAIFQAALATTTKFPQLSLQDFLA